MSLLVGLLSAVGILLWPGRYDLHALTTLPAGLSAPSSFRGSRSVLASALGHGRRLIPGRSAAGVTAQDLLGLLESVAPALDAGMAPATALRIAADARTGPGHLDPLAALASEMATAAAEGAMLGSLWRRAAESAGSAELLLLAQAWSLTEEMGVPLAHAVRTTAGLLEARIAQERRLSGAVAGAQATVNLLTVLPVGGPLLALVLGIGPGTLYAGSGLTQASLVLGLCLAGIGRGWVRRMVRAVARGPVVA